MLIKRGFHLKIEKYFDEIIVFSLFLYGNLMLQRWATPLQVNLFCEKAIIWRLFLRWHFPLIFLIFKLNIWTGDNNSSNAVPMHGRPRKPAERWPHIASDWSVRSDRQKGFLWDRPLYGQLSLILLIFPIFFPKWNILIKYLKIKKLKKVW